MAFLDEQLLMEARGFIREILPRDGEDDRPRRSIMNKGNMEP
ncbi:MAG TPA: hypothetical protein VMW89_05315 [Desulfatiglandales bacterium]|nr:hypothetical protein [Desulfatiglandales bacterium]